MLFFCIISLAFLQREPRETANRILLDVEWNANYEGTQQEYLKDMHDCYDIPMWSSWACGGHGSCVEKDHCICKVPFKGKNCTKINFTHHIMKSFLIGQDPDVTRTPPLPHCDGIRIDQMGACGEGGHDGIAHFGVCVLNNTCRCYCGWSGYDCKTFTYDNYAEKREKRKDKFCLEPYPEEILKEN